MIVGMMIGLIEMLLYIKVVGFDLEKVLVMLFSGGVDNWSMDNYVFWILKDDYMFGFFVCYFFKDLWIVLSEVDVMGFNLVVMV